MRNKDLKLRTYNYIKDHEELPEFLSPSHLNYYTKQLREEGYVKKLGSSRIWKVLKPYTKLLQKKVQTMRGTGNKKGVRSHAYRFKIKLPFLDNWMNRRKYFKRLKIKSTPLPNGGDKIFCRRHCVHLFDDSIVIIFYKGKSFRVYHAKEGDARALMEVKFTLQALENKLKMSLKYGQSWRLNCYSRHHALIRNALAKWYLKRGVKQFHIIGDDGKEWLLMDNSFNLEELEGVHGKRATKDVDVVVAPLMNRLREDPLILDKLETKSRDIDEIKNLLYSTIDLVKSNAILHKGLTKKVDELTTKR